MLRVVALVSVGRKVCGNYLRFYAGDSTVGPGCKHYWLLLGPEWEYGHRLDGRLHRRVLRVGECHWWHDLLELLVKISDLNIALGVGCQDESHVRNHVADLDLVAWNLVQRVG